MSDQQTMSPDASRAPSPQAPRGNAVTRFFRAIGLFFSQVIDEMRKVVPPSRQELRSYTIIVIVFVTVVMLAVFGLDALFTKLVFWVFAGS